MSMINQVKRSVLMTLAAGLSFGAMAQTSSREVPKGWHLKDRQKDGYYGISLEQAYEFVKNKKSNTVIVAVIDSGIDTTHEDLKPVLWTNPKEIADNGIDDDKNGYVDDVHGWNFIGGRDGRNVKEDSYEAARVYHKFKERFSKVTDPSTLSAEERDHFDMWKRAEKQIAGDSKGGGLELLMLKRTYTVAVSSDSVLRKAIGKDTYTGKELQAFTPATDEAKKAKSTFLYFFTSSNALEMSNQGFLGDFREYLDSEEKKSEAADKAPKNYRAEIVKDNYDDLNDRFYGNNDIMANTPMHGTHVAGIIAAARNNGKGMDGVAGNVQIMTIRAVPDGDEHDKDIALAIRYAVDNGARVVNMSFGKGFSPEKKWVDEAVKYAESKGVLLVHAAGNDAANVDTVQNYPSPALKAENRKANNWITVGASGDPKAGGLVASFSNYGKKEVDVFAPGVRIYSTMPGGTTYGNLQGTSMASPVVAGVAAFLFSYYPELSAQQVKEVIEKSAVAPGIKATNPSTDQSVDLTELSKTGGVVNAFEAAKMAAGLNGTQKAPVAKEVKMKTKVKKKKRA